MSTETKKYSLTINGIHLGSYDSHEGAVGDWLFLSVLVANLPPPEIVLVGALSAPVRLATIYA